MKNNLIGRRTMAAAMALSLVWTLGISAGATAGEELAEQGTQTQTEAAFETEPGDAGQATEEESEEEAADPIRGIYISAYVAGMESMMDNIIAGMEGTSLNAIVIDVKNDDGNIVYDMDSDLIDELGTEKILVKDMPGLMDKLHDHGIYAIARVVTMRDPLLDDVKPDWMLHKADGSVYEDKKGFAWIDPTCPEAREYLVEVALQCRVAGFDEVQFDYVRYPTGITGDDLGMNGYEKRHAIYKFVRRAHMALQREDIPLSLDLFGTVIPSKIDRNIVGQDYAWLSVDCEFLSPMIYPSHYADGSMGLDHPDLYPYECIDGAMKASAKELKTVNPRGDRTQASVRPWLQGFTASYLTHYRKYGAEELKAQIKAVEDNGVDSWIIWNPACKYPWEAFTAN